MRNYLTRRNGNNFGLGLFDDAFENFFSPIFYTPTHQVMKTDVKETESDYQLLIDMPGFNKEDLSLTLKNGYLTVKAEKKEEQEEKFVVRERSFNCERSYFVGDSVTEEDVKAKYENGILSLTIPKMENKIPPRKTIQID